MWLLQVRWTDGGLPKRLCLRVQEAGWLWSGGIALNSPGDLFVKIRHRCSTHGMQACTSSLACTSRFCCSICMHLVRTTCLTLFSEPCSPPIPVAASCTDAKRHHKDRGL